MPPKPVDLEEAQSSESGNKRTRSFTGRSRRVMTAFTALFALYVLLYIGGIFSYLGLYIYPVIHNAVSLLFAMVLCYLFFPVRRSRAVNNQVPWYDMLAIVLSIVVNVYLLVNYGEINQALRVETTTLESVLAVIAIVLILEAIRRTVSPYLALLGLLFVTYPLVANYMPGFLHGTRISLERVLFNIYLFPIGIYGSILQLFSNILIPFLIFGSFLAVSGAGEFFVNLATALVGAVRGGPAKVGVIASALFGMINGSSMANAAAMGVITIPMMKNVGYRPVFAAAVEAVASNGGQIMPPVMGLAAFLMVDFLRIPYRTIMIAGFIPALFYFLAVLFMVDLEAARTGLKGLPKENLPSLRKTFAEGWFYLIPVGVLLVFMMVLQFSAETSCFYAIIAMIAVSFLGKKKAHMGPKNLVAALSDGVRTIPDIGNVVALSGMLTAALAMTGLDLRFTGGLLSIAGNNLLVLIILTAIIALILGTGLPTSAVYLLCAMLLAPAIIKLGVLPLAAHFFLLYYGVAALITPPVCTVAFITASIAGAPFMGTGWQACRMGIVTFILPFFFIYSPELLMVGSAGPIALAIITGIIGVWLLAGGIEGYLIGNTNWPVRIMLLASGLLMIAPGWIFDIVGVAIGGAALVWQVGLTRLLLAVRRRAVS